MIEKIFTDYPIFDFPFSCASIIGRSLAFYRYPRAPIIGNLGILLQMIDLPYDLPQAH
jgi:hypothetical protein